MSEGVDRKIALALGSNLGDRLQALRAAIKALQPYMTITAVSQVYETAAAYVTDQPIYLNAAVIGTTKLDPLPLLWVLKDVETEVGRLPTFRYGPRVIDIDILFYDDVVITTTELTIPHPRLPERDFVLRPLADIAAAWVHPITHQTVAQMLAVQPDNGMVCLGTIL